MVLSLGACSSGSSSTGEKYTAGTYSASAKGFGGDVTVTLTVDSDKITDVVVEGNDETPAVGGAALETLQKEILDKQSSEIDVVSGATVTSTAVQEATAVPAGSLRQRPRAPYFSVSSSCLLMGK